MDVVQVKSPGGPDELELVARPDPEPGPGEVLVRVAAAGVNRADLLQREGRYPPPPGAPAWPGLEVSGVVAGHGPGVDLAAWPLGARVAALLPGGGYATLAAVPAGLLLPVPEEVDLVDAAGLPEALLTSWTNVVDAGRLAPDEVLLVQGGSGGVGSVAVQLGAALGAHVVATASPRSAEAVRAAGADEVVDRTTTSLLDAVTEPVDVLVNLAPITADDFAALAGRVRDGGVVVSTTPRVPTPDDPARGVRAVTVYLHPDADVLRQLVALVDAGDLRVDIARRVPLADLPTLHAEADAGRVHGKVVVVPPAA